ncbi:hypothetical protein CXB51_019007 [Gossypium anomalum]|uniref:Retrotransposon gag protein n=1 Tax=Gossypium anomalum TaxID=47600 RepID=A0A8J5YNI4_9ROSI|nr:hypothetical protein CXB51_019007 [Gossypium anomalum]
MDLETLYDAWERYKDLLRMCPHHGLPLWLEVQTFHNGLNPLTRQMIDAATGGTINNKTPEEAYEFIEEMSLNNYQWQVMRTKPTKAIGIFNVDSVTMLSNQVHPVMQSKASGGGTSNSEYPPYGHNIEKEQMNYMGQGNQRPPPSPGFQQQPYQQEKKPNLEGMMTKFISVAKTHFQNTETALKNQQASIQGLENQIGHLAKMILERPPESLPSNTEPNPKEHVKAVTLRSGKVLAESEKKPPPEVDKKEDEEEKTRKQ